MIGDKITWTNEKKEPIEAICRYCKGPIETTRQASGMVTVCAKDGVIRKGDVIDKHRKPNYSSSGEGKSK